jgi:hypothetical protein
MKFPITALELANLAQDRLDKQSELVQKQMVDDLLPRTVSVILARQEDCRRIYKSWDSATAKRIIENSAQALWSNPGSMGGLQIERQLIANGINREDADTLATNIVRYSRYSMSVVNSLRHYKSAISGVRDILEPIQFRDRYLAFPALPQKLQIEWPPKAEAFGKEKFTDAGQISKWLNDIEKFIAEVNSASTWARRRPLQEQDPEGWKRTSSLNTSMAKAYTRRYGRFLTQEFEEINLKGRYVPSSRSRIESIRVELENLKAKLRGDDQAVFKLFEDDYKERSFRIPSLSRPPSRQTSSRGLSQQSFFEAYITNQFKLGGRDLIVKSSQERISPALIDQMYKLFKTQLELEPKLSKFEGTVAREGQILTVDLNEPAVNDATKLRKFLNTLFGN